MIRFVFCFSCFRVWVFICVGAFFWGFEVSVFVVERVVVFVYGVLGGGRVVGGFVVFYYVFVVVVVVVVVEERRFFYGRREFFV